MKIFITGSSSGIGKAIALKFLKEGHEVLGMDILDSTITDPNYKHFKQSICDELPEITDLDILINNAGVQNSEDDIDINLKGTMKVTEKYGINPHIKSILNIASSSATSGAEFPVYCASKGGLLAYTKNVSMRVSEFGATCNSLSPGGVITDLNKHILDDENLWKQVLDETLLKKWATCEEIADWAYFLTVVNKSMTGQDLLVDNGESNNFHFIW